MIIPKYVKELMSRARYNYTCQNYKDYAVGYTIDIEKETYYKRAETLKKEILRLGEWVKRQGGEMVILYCPIGTQYQMQYATVTIFDPVMTHIERYIGVKEEKPLDLCNLMCN